MFNEQIIQQVWEKAKVVDGYNPNLWRQDSLMHGFVVMLMVQQ